MDQLNIPKSIDANADGKIDKKDVMILKDVLKSLNFESKKNFLNGLNTSVVNNKDFLTDLKNVLENEFNVLDMKDSDLYLLYQTLFLDGDILEKEYENKNDEIYENNKEYFSSIYKQYKNLFEDNGITQDEYKKIMYNMGVSNIVSFINHNGVVGNHVQLLINHKNFSNILDNQSIFFSGVIDISELLSNKSGEKKEEILEKIKIISNNEIFITSDNYGFLEDDKIKSIDLKNLFSLGYIDYKGYMRLKDMGENIDTIKKISEDYKEEYEILMKTGIEQSIIVDLIKSGFPIKEFHEQINQDNAIIIATLYNRKLVGQNKLSTENIVGIANVTSLFSNPLNYVNFLEENKDNCILEMWDNFDFIKKNVQDFQNIFGFENISLVDYVAALFYVDYSPLLDDNQSFVDLYLQEYKKNPNLGFVDIANLLIEKMENGDVKTDKNIDISKDSVKEKDPLNDLIKSKRIDVALFSEYILPLLDKNVNIKKEDGHVKIDADDTTREYILDVLNLDGLNEFLYYLKEENPKITVLGKEIIIRENIQFIKDILEYRKLNKDLEGVKDFGQIIESYSQDLNEFLEIPSKKDTIFVSFQVNQLMGGDSQGAFLGEKGLLKDIFKNSKHIDLSPNKENGILKPKQILDRLEDILKNNPNNDVIFYIGVHGAPDGSAAYSGGELSKQFFENINDLANKYPNFKVKIDSCYSGFKLDKNKINGNIYITSEKEVATSEISTILHENKGKMDYNNDGIVSFKETAFTEMLNYKGSLLGFYNFHSFVKNRHGELRKLSGADRVLLNEK